MVEIVIVLLIFGILATVGITSIPSYLVRRRDAQRKADLHNMKVAFEDYVGDKSSYPPVGIITSCGSTSLSPYLRKIPCDPYTAAAYSYVLAADGQSYQIYTNLEDTTDGDIASQGCTSGCGPGKAYNYGVVGGGALMDR